MLDTQAPQDYQRPGDVRQAGYLVGRDVELHPIVASLRDTLESLDPTSPPHGAPLDAGGGFDREAG